MLYFQNRPLKDDTALYEAVLPILIAREVNVRTVTEEKHELSRILSVHNSYGKEIFCLTSMNHIKLLDDYDYVKDCGADDETIKRAVLALIVCMFGVTCSKDRLRGIFECNDWLSSETIYSNFYSCLRNMLIREFRIDEGYGVKYDDFMPPFEAVYLNIYLILGKDKYLDISEQQFFADTGVRYRSLSKYGIDHRKKRVDIQEKTAAPPGVKDIALVYGMFSAD